MSLRSYIFMKQSDGGIKGIYCHRNGELDMVGQCLYENYHEANDLESLINLGNIAELGETVEETIAYVRDNHEQWEDNQWLCLKNESQLYQRNDMMISYQYLYDVENYIWYVFHRDEGGHWIKEELYDALVKEEAFE